MRKKEKINFVHFCAKKKMVVSFCRFEVAFKEKECNELFSSSQWKFEFGDFKPRTLVLTTKS
jgi:hypothetical protein